MKLRSSIARLGTTATLACLLAVLTATQLAFQAHAMGVVAFDYGTEWMKVSLVKPGLPFDVVLDRDSKRKIQSAVSFKKWGLDEEVLYGANAYNHATREPKQSFYALKTLLGKSFADNDKPYRDHLASIFGNDVVATERGTCALQRPYKPDNSSSYPTLSVEELVGMQLEYGKKLAEETAGERVQLGLPANFNIGSFGGLDTVVTVPAFFTAAERQAIYDSAALAGFRPRLVSDGAAAAVNYAQTRTFPQPEKHLFYDAGSGSVRATVVEFSTQAITADSVLSIGNTQKEAIVINVLGVGWDREAGGLKLDLILRDKLAEEFDKQHGAQLSGGSIKSNHRAMARLLKEANRVKHILSANEVANSGIEGLAEDIDFRTSIDRRSFEDAVERAGLPKRFTDPITAALRNAGLAMDGVKSVVLVGGTTRVPLVQAALRSAGVPDDKIAQNVNADEAAVMGAAFYGASYNPQFRMKAIRAYDLVPYPVTLREGDGSEEVIYPAKSYEVEGVLRRYPGVTEDFSFELQYDASAERLLEARGRAISKVELTGISESLKDLRESNQLGSVETQVNVTIVSRPLGTYMVESATLTVKPKPGGIAGALKSFFGVGTPSTGSKKEANATKSENATEPPEADDKAAEEEAELTAKDRVIKLTARTIPLPGALPPMSGEEQKKSKDRLWTMSQAAARKAAREEARNGIESYLYRVRDMLYDPVFEKVSKASERDAISAKVEELSEWLGDEGERAETATLKLKRASLEKLVKPLETRLAQSKTRTAAFAAFERSIEASRAFVAEARANLTAALAANESSKYSQTELDQLDKQVERDAEWFDKGKAEQAKRGEDEDPAILSEDLERRRKKVEETIAKLRKRRIPKTRPNKKKPAAAAADNKKADDEKAKDKPEADAPPKHQEL
ncbi:lumenal Hsp70 protein [Thecaphora frezii]|nr:putative actin-like atpase domain-containing protein [Thecaphora frezii]